MRKWRNFSDLDPKVLCSKTNEKPYERQSANKDSPRGPRVVRFPVSDVRAAAEHREPERFRVPESPIRNGAEARRSVLPREEFSHHERHRDSFRHHDDMRSRNRHRYYDGFRPSHGMSGNLSEMERRWLQRMLQGWRY